jgi:hypothetical protein
MDLSFSIKENIFILYYILFLYPLAIVLQAGKQAGATLSSQQK